MSKPSTKIARLLVEPEEIIWNPYLSEIADEITNAPELRPISTERIDAALMSLVLSNVPKDDEIQKAFCVLRRCNINAPIGLTLLIAQRALRRWPDIKRNQSRRTAFGYKIRQPDENVTLISFSKEQELMDQISLLSSRNVHLPQSGSLPKNLLAYQQYRPSKNDMISRFLLAGLSLFEYRNEFLGIFVGHHIYQTPLATIQKMAPCFDSENIWHRYEGLSSRLKDHFGLPYDPERIELRPASEDEAALIQCCLETFVPPYPPHGSVTSKKDIYEVYFREMVPTEPDQDRLVLIRNHLTVCPQCYGWESLIKDAKLGSPLTTVHVPTFVDAFPDEPEETLSSSALGESELALIMKRRPK